MNDSLRIAHIVDSSRMWGVENYILNLATALNRRQVETWVLCRDPLVQETYRRNGINVKPLQLAGYFDLSGMLSLIRFCKDHRIDVIHTHLGLDSWIGAAAAKACNIACVMSVHFLEPDWQSAGQLTRAFWLPTQKLKNSLISKFLPITPQVADRLVDREGVDPKKLKVVCPGIPAGIASPERRISLRRSLGVQLEDCVVLSLSRLEPEKNISVMIKSAAVLTAENQRLHFWVAGDGSQRKSLEQHIEQLGLGDRFKLLGYWPDARELLSAADIFVLPAIAEPFGMAAVEAMLASLPVVGFGNAGLSVIVENECTGLLVSNGDEGALTNCIRSLANDPTVRRRFGHAGYLRAVRDFSDEMMAEKVLAAYQNVIRTCAR
ncbi:MAG TPA: glycosyltransferase family 4 protein [Candidatus Obscuribacterales bacterium]